MNTLCFLSNITSEQWAAWVQAIGSILAIAGTGIGVWYQTSKQHQSAMSLYQLEKRHARLELAKTLHQLSVNCLRVVQYVSREFNSRGAIYDFASGKKHVDWVQLRSIEDAVVEIPLINLPSTLVTYSMILGSTIRQLRENIEFSLKGHREMDSNAFATLFTTIAELQASLEITCGDIGVEVKKIEDADRPTT